MTTNTITVPMSENHPLAMETLRVDMVPFLNIITTSLIKFAAEKCRETQNLQQQAYHLDLKVCSRS